MPSTPITPTELDRIRTLHGEGLSLRAIAHDIGRAYSTVGKHCREMGLVFDSERTQAATAKRKATSAEKRADLESRLLDEAAACLDLLAQPHTVYSFGGRDNTYAERQLPAPDPGARRTLIQAAGTAIDKAVRLAEVDRATSGAEVGKSMVGNLFAGLAAIAQEQQETPDPG